MHRRPTDYAYFRRLQPSVFKIMDGGANDYVWAREHLPDSLVIARDHALSEQHEDMLKAPGATGKRHAQEWNNHQERLGFDRAKTLILGINEPKVWDGGVSEALRQYTIAMCDEALRLGLRVGAMQFSVGWPANTAEGKPPDWSPWHGVENAIKRGNHMLVCHEYWADNGPGEMWGWWGGRVLKCPWQVPIVIGETGIDMYVKTTEGPHADRGWRGHVDATRYAQELAEYVGLMSEDSRFVGCCVFASDFAAGEWYSFDVEPAYDEILVTPIPEPTPEPEPEPTPPPDPGAIVEGMVTATAGLNMREGPGTSYPILGTLAHRSTVLYDQTENGWHHLPQGYVSGEWVGPVVPPTTDFDDGPQIPERPQPGSPQGPDAGTVILVHPLPGSVITQHWGENGQNYAIWQLWGHDGCDMGGRPADSPIGALSDGVVVDTGFDENGYGNYVRLAHDRLGAYSLYAHCSSVLVAVGQMMSAGETIALLGSTGNSTGLHLHLEIRLMNSAGAYSNLAPMPRGRVDPETFCAMHNLKL